MSRHRMDSRHSGPPAPAMASWLITVFCLTAVAMLVLLAVFL